MMRAIIAVTIALTLLSAASASAQSEPTHFRKQHTLLLVGNADRPITVHLTAIRASLGYPDALVWRLFAPLGNTAAQGRLEPGESETVEVPPAGGAYLLDANPGMNAFSVDAEGAIIVVDVGATRQVNVIDIARPLFFLVPEDLGEVSLRFSGEAGSMELRAPDGTVVAARELPLYETVEVTVPVAPGRAGWWRLDLQLSEDQSITFPAGVAPVVAEAPLTPEVVEQLTTAPALVNFDLRPTPRVQLLGAARGPATATVATDDGLTLGFDAAGRLASVTLDGAEVLPAGEAPPVGLLARDVAADSPPVVAEGRVREVEGDLLATLSAPGLDLDLQALYAAMGDHISVTVTVTNRRDSDRAITVYFALPFPSGSATWWDGIVATRPAEGNLTLGAFDSISAGANGRHSVLPFGCIAADEGLALAVPMDYPILHRIAACPATGQFFLAVDLGLTEATAKFPNRARFHFTIYRCDPRWGLRAAAERYYRIFPELFEKRMLDDGGWVAWGNLADVPNFEQLGFLYHWGPAGPEAVAFDDARGVYSFLYSDSARFFADLGEFDHRPSREECTGAMRALLDAADPRAVILSARANATGRRRYESLEARMGRAAAERFLRDQIEAVKRSAAIDGAGAIQVGYLVNREDWGGTDWWTGRAFCDIDPDIPGGYGRFLFDRILDPAVESYRAEGAEPDGFGLDNFFSNARTLDFDREHLAACDFPVTFAAGDFRPVVTGDSIMYEWTAELKRRLEAEGKWLMANTCVQPFCFAQHLLDVNGLEWNLEGASPLARVLAYHKQVVSLPMRPEHYQEPFIRAHLPMGVFPGGYASASRFAPDTEIAALYARYLPILRRMSAAGWEPVPWAWADDERVTIERFGSGANLLLSLHNHAAEVVRTTVHVDLDRLGAGAARAVTDLPSGQALETTGAVPLAFAVELAAGDATVVEVR